MSVAAHTGKNFLIFSAENRQKAGEVVGELHVDGFVDTESCSKVGQGALSCVVPQDGSRRVAGQYPKYEE